MRILKSIQASVILLCIYGSAVHADDDFSCQANNNLNFSATVPEILAQTSTVNSVIQTSNSDSILYSCSENATFKAEYKMDVLADLNAQSNLQFGQYTFYKIKSVQGRTSGNLAIDYLINHAYIAFSFRSVQQTQKVNVTSESQIIDLTSEALDIHNSGLSIIDAQLYVDALPDSDALTEQLNSENIQLNIGQLNVEATTTNTSIDMQKNWKTTVSPRINVNISGISFKRPTCVFINQTVILPTLSAGAFASAPSAAGNPISFDLNLQCNGYLNQRKFSMMWSDNHAMSNVNNDGYLSSEIANGMSNVGVQIKNELNEPIQIGQIFDLNDAITGLGFIKKYNVQYYLPNGKPTIGKVNAQAILSIEYR